MSKDPRLEEVSDADLEKQLALALAIRDATSRANEAVMALSDAAARIRSRMEGGPQDTKGANDLLERLHAVESRLYQTRNRSPKDKIAYPIRLNDRLAGLLSKVESGDAAPTSAHHEIFALLNMELGELLGETENLLQRDVPALLAQSTSERQGGR